MLQEAQRNLRQSLKGSIRTGGFDRHVQRTGNARALERLILAYSSRTASGPAFDFCKIEFLAAPIGQ